MRHSEDDDDDDDDDDGGYARGERKSQQEK